jgi:hypothetical protein
LPFNGKRKKEANTKRSAVPRVDNKKGLIFKKEYEKNKKKDVSVASLILYIFVLFNQCDVC